MQYAETGITPWNMSTTSVTLNFGQKKKELCLKPFIWIIFFTGKWFRKTIISLRQLIINNQQSIIEMKHLRFPAKVQKVVLSMSTIPSSIFPMRLSLYSLPYSTLLTRNFYMCILNFHIS